jgi:tRNA(Leu) C34 or U34 (ribose-2'-O)-methylase TrmL
VFENPVNIYNVLASLRSFDAFGIHYISLILNSDISQYNQRKKGYKKSISTTLSYQKWLSLSEYNDSITCLNKLKSEGYRIVATDLHETSLPMKEINWNIKTAIVMGNEDTGISEEVRKIADDRMFIPMKGFASAIIASYLDNIGVLKGNLHENVKKRILLLWLIRTIPGSIELLKRKGIQITDNDNNNSISSVGLKTM